MHNHPVLLNGRNHRPNPTRRRHRIGAFHVGCLWAAWALLSACPTEPDLSRSGWYACITEAECPEGWTCRAASNTNALRCFAPEASAPAGDSSDDLSLPDSAPNDLTAPSDTLPTELDDSGPSDLGKGETAEAEDAATQDLDRDKDTDAEGLPDPGTEPDPGGKQDTLSDDGPGPPEVLADGDDGDLGDALAALDGLGDVMDEADLESPDSDDSDGASTDAVTPACDETTCPVTADPCTEGFCLDNSCVELPTASQACLQGTKWVLVSLGLNAQLDGSDISIAQEAQRVQLNGDGGVAMWRLLDLRLESNGPNTNASESWAQNASMASFNFAVEDPGCANKVTHWNGASQTPSAWTESLRGALCLDPNDGQGAWVGQLNAHADFALLRRDAELGLLMRRPSDLQPPTIGALAGRWKIVGLEHRDDALSASTETGVLPNFLGWTGEVEFEDQSGRSCWTEGPHELRPDAHHLETIGALSLNESSDEHTCVDVASYGAFVIEQRQQAIGEGSYARDIAWTGWVSESGELAIALIRQPSTVTDNSPFNHGLMILVRQPEESPPITSASLDGRWIVGGISALGHPDTDPTTMLNTGSRRFGWIEHDGSTGKFGKQQLELSTVTEDGASTSTNTVSGVYFTYPLDTEGGYGPIQWLSLGTSVLGQTGPVDAKLQRATALLGYRPVTQNLQEPHPESILRLQAAPDIMLGIWASPLEGVW